MRKILVFVLFCSVAFAENPYRVFNNFNAGELSPLLNAREDLAKYQSGCQIMENLIPLPQGGATKRPGTKYIAEVKTSSLATRLLPFEFSTSQSYIIEAGNQYMRFYTNGAQITHYAGTETPIAGSIVAHWLLNDNLATTAVIDDDGATHDGVATANTDTLYQPGRIGTGCFDLDGQYTVAVADAAAFSFGDDADDSAFSLTAWIYVTSTGGNSVIISKWDTNSKREWIFTLQPTKILRLRLGDDGSDKFPYKDTDDALANGWHFVAATYDGTGGATAMTGVTIYVDGAAVAATGNEEALYDAMNDLAAPVHIGASLATGTAQVFWADKIDEVTVYSTELSAANITTLYGSLATYELATPYLTADLFELKYEQSADVLYITHPDYEPHKLSRLDTYSWSIDPIEIENGPFRTQNETVSFTLACSATSGTGKTLTASGGSPFVEGTTSGHLPSGSSDTSKSQTGALFKLVHPIATLEYAGQLEEDIVASQTEDVSWMDCGVLYKGAGWTLVTKETWHGTIKVQRNYTIGAVYATAGWETVFSFTSGVVDAAEPRNVSTTGTEDDGDAQYRVIYADELGAGGDVDIYFSTDQTEHTGIVEITAVASPTSATVNVLTTLASTDATYKWSEGSWSNYRGWPQTVAFFEDRLVFGGNTDQPDTLWASVTSDYENMLEGAEDDDALNFTLSSRQVNVIEWLVGKDKILIGTSGAEWTMEGSADEPLTPSNVMAEQHSTYGSANVQATLANESVLFFQRGKEKMRELAYNWELDSYVAPDMTILSNFITDGGIAETAFQKTPDSILWCIRDDGEMPVFSYERKENITAWSRIVTEDGNADSDFESVVRIHGSPEDEIWAIVERTIDGSVVRYVEQFQDRDFGSDADDAYYVDCGVTYDSTASSAMTGLDHLEGETVYVLADGVVFDTEVVSGGAITLSLDDVTTTASTVQMGLPYEVHLQTMPLSWLGGITIQGRQKRIGEVVASWYNSGDFSIGKDTSNLETYSISGQTTSQDRKTFPPGYSREGSVYIYQKSPEPLTLLGIATEFTVQQ